MSTIEALDSVSAIWPVTLYSRPVPDIENIVNLSELTNETYSNQYGPHVMTGVDKLHAQGYMGQGVSIAIIDSGVDYRYDNYRSL